jgi:hypothetical protein
MLSALVPPLSALVALHALAGAKPGEHGAPAALCPDEATAVTGPGRRPFATRTDRQGHARRVYFPGVALTGEAPERARRLVVALAPQLGVTAAQLDLECTSVRRSPSGEHVRLQQRAGGIPVWGAEAVVSFAATTRAPLVVASDLEEPPGELTAAASVSQAQAVAIAMARLAARGLQLPPRSELYRRQRPDGWTLEYRVSIPCAAPLGDWEAWIDAESGAVREIRDRTVHARAASAGATSTGTGRVFLPDPCLVTGDPTLRDEADADAAVPEAAYSTVSLRDLAPPRGGYYHLEGPWVVLADWESPAGAPDSSASLDFARHRAASGFEDVMVYYHLDALQRWYRALGFTDANAHPQVADAHGAYGADNSKFVPSTHKIAYGEGGVDDAEDAEVIVHEYGHATQFDIVPTWGTGGHTSAMGEGFGDYLANSYAWSMHPGRVEQWNGVFQWDGHNEYWAGRPAVDPSLHYPEDATGNIYRGGTLWCSALSEALYALQDRTVMDRLVVDHHYALTGTATMEDAANAILASDVALYQGAHLAVLVEVFGRWGLVDASAWMPIAIEHAPLDIQASTDREVRIAARVVASVAPVAIGSVVVHVRAAGTPWVMLPLALQAGEYAATLRLPAGGATDLEYFVEARDAAGNVARLPAGGESAPFQIGVGIVAERFETESGWRTDPAADATAGKWVRVIPVETSAQPGADHTTAGTTCFVTGNGVPGSPASDSDVDGGATTLLSPVYDVEGCTRVRLSYWRWFSNDKGGAPGEDPWCVDVSNDGGATWASLERTTQSDARWRYRVFDLAALFAKPDRVRVRFVASDRGTASLVEAAVDDVLLQAARPTGVPDSNAIAPPGCPSLEAWPNPGRSATEFRFALARPAGARLEIFDARGRRVRTLLDGPQAPGAHVVRWNGCDAAGRRLPAGVYLTRLETATGTSTLKLALLR